MTYSTSSSQRLPPLAGKGAVPASPCRDSTHLLHSGNDRLRKRLSRDGYLFLRGVISPIEVSQVNT